jgi:hypothetical protein
MSETYSGECKGGPMDGKMLAHYSRRYELFKPMVAFSPRMHADERVEAIKIGEYRINDYHMWVWWGTKDGAAYEQLFGT